MSRRHIFILSARGLTVVLALSVLLGIKMPWILTNPYYFTMFVGVLIFSSLAIEVPEYSYAIKICMAGIVFLLFITLAYNLAFYRLALFFLFSFALRNSYEFIFTRRASELHIVGFLIIAALVTSGLSSLANPSLLSIRSLFLIFKSLILSLVSLL